jgi:hypothetical protein
MPIPEQTGAAVGMHAQPQLRLASKGHFNKLLRSEAGIWVIAKDGPLPCLQGRERIVASVKLYLRCCTSSPRVAA